MNYKTWSEKVPVDLNLEDVLIEYCSEEKSIVGILEAPVPGITQHESRSTYT